MTLVIDTDEARSPVTAIKFVLTVTTPVAEKLRATDPAKAEAVVFAKYHETCVPPLAGTCNTATSPLRSDTAYPNREPEVPVNEYREAITELLGMASRTPVNARRNSVSAAALPQRLVISGHRYNLRQ
jgi:hypothetical protein